MKMFKDEKKMVLEKINLCLSELGHVESDETFKELEKKIARLTNLMSCYNAFNMFQGNIEKVLEEPKQEEQNDNGKTLN